MANGREPLQHRSPPRRVRITILSREPLPVRIEFGAARTAGGHRASPPGDGGSAAPPHLPGRRSG